MQENKVVFLRRKDEIDDPLTEILRSGARRLIAQAVEAEFETFLTSTCKIASNFDPARYALYALTLFGNIRIL